LVPTIKISEHPAYAKYFKSLSMQVPIEHIKFKMAQEGLNSDVLEMDPNTLVAVEDLPQQQKPSSVGLAIKSQNQVG
jgi:hypothetical protein